MYLNDVEQHSPKTQTTALTTTLNRLQSQQQLDWLQLRR